MSFKKTLLAAAILACAGFASASMAASPATGSFDITLTIQSACTVDNAADIAFASLESNAVLPAAMSGEISVTCSKGTAYNISLTPSGSATDGTGLLAGTGVNTDTIAYKLSTDAAGSLPWGNSGVDATDPGNGVASSAGTPSAATGTAPQVFEVYATITGTLSDVLPDDYSDTVAVNVYY